MLTKLNYFLNKFILLWFIAFFASTAYNQEINEFFLPKLTKGQKIE